MPIRPHAWAAAVRSLAAAALCLFGVSSALAQAPTTTTRYDLDATTWVDICTAPCVVRTLGVNPAMVAVGGSAPSGDAPATVLRDSAETGLLVNAAGKHVYARALNGTTRVVVLPTDAFGGSSGSGGSAPSSAFSVARTTGIGTTGVQVSATDSTNRRTVTNTSAVDCEVMPAATAYGTGHPLPAGSSFTFDSSGQTTAAIFVACSASGGSVSVLSY